MVENVFLTVGAILGPAAFGGLRARLPRRTFGEARVLGGEPVRLRRKEPGGAG